MRLNRTICLILAVFAVALPTGAKPKKPVVPAVFGTARYVYVEAMDGDEMSARVDPDDREAIANVREALERWGRYKLVYDRSQAELIFVVRRGRQLGGRAGGGVGTGGDPIPGQPRVQPGGVSLGASADVSAGPATDQLRVYQTTPEGKQSSQVWMEESGDGLGMPALALVRRLKAAVDEAYPPPDPKARRP